MSKPIVTTRTHASNAKYVEIDHRPILNYIRAVRSKTFLTYIDYERVIISKTREGRGAIMYRPINKRDVFYRTPIVSIFRLQVIDGRKSVVQWPGRRFVPVYEGRERRPAKRCPIST